MDTNHGDTNWPRTGCVSKEWLEGVNLRFSNRES